MFPADFEGKLSGLLRLHMHERIDLGCSGAEVFYLPDLAAYLKVGMIDKNSDLGGERNVLEWINGKLDVPKILNYERSGETESLLISEVVGIPASQYVSVEGGTLETIRDFLKKAASRMREIHKIPIAGCPLDQRLDVKLAKAWRNIHLGFVDEADFESENLGKTAIEIFRELEIDLPQTEDLVFTHGDFCLPNIIVRENEIAGFIDMDRGGVADRYQDIAVFLRSFQSNVAVNIDFDVVFCKAYGLESLDRYKLNFYRKLDELF